MFIENSMQVETSKHFCNYTLFNQQIYKKIHGEDAIKFKEQFKFQDPPSGKLVGEVEETRGNGWAVAIAGCPEVDTCNYSVT